MAFPDPTSPQWARLIGDLYESAVAPAGLSRLSEIFVEVVGGVSGAVCLFGGGAPQIITSGVPDDAVAAYDQHFGALDPWTKHTMSPALRGCLPATIGRRILPEAELFKTEFYAGFARPFDMFEVLGGSVPVGHGKVAVYSVQRAGCMKRYDECDEQRVRHLAPHLQRALQLRGRFIGDAEDVGFAALERMSFGAMVCDAAGRLLFANSVAERAAAESDALVLPGKDGCIGAALPADRRRLLYLVRDACLGGPGGSIALRDESGAALLVLVAPLPRRYGDAAPLALLALRSASAPMAVKPEILASLFKLTPAETELTLALVRGISLSEIGVLRGTTENTLRSQLRQIFRKTGVHNQAALVGLIGTLPPVR